VCIYPFVFISFFNCDIIFPENLSNILKIKTYYFKNFTNKKHYFLLPLEHKCGKITNNCIFCEVCIFMIAQNKYRTHSCGELRESDINKQVRIAGWVDTIRDHGGILFVDLRDSEGTTQVVVHDEAMLENVTRESVIAVAGNVVLRDEETVNPKIATGKVEVVADSLSLISRANSNLPFEISSSTETKEEVRLTYRYLDLRNKKLHDNIALRAKLLSFLRNQMTERGFLEIQTPILSASSPEGARDYLIPSRKHHGKFYALPQAPQIFKQLLMVSGFDRYFQIAPCFRDEDARADRSPGEFYQLDFEMAFATQEDVLNVAEEVLYATFKEFTDKEVTPAPFVRIPYEEAMLKYGSDKPDLRNPLEIIDVSDLFVNSDFKPFSNKTVRAINAPCGTRSKKFFSEMENFALDIGMKGLGYIKVDESGKYLGPIDKFLNDEQREALRNRASLKTGDVLYFIADSKDAAAKFAGQIRTELGNRLELLSDDFRLCFIVDFPMFEQDEETGKIIFTHNPFSMPQGGLEALNTQNPLDIKAYQYDIVCNGIELSSGAVRNHEIDTLVKAFEIAGYTEDDLKEKFRSLYSAFQYGAPPHAGMAPGFDRLLMLLCGEESIREVIAFPMNSNAQDLLMGAPSEVTEGQLREVHIKIR
jgi:aspartyl-tRNA synthetase